MKKILDLSGREILVGMPAYYSDGFTIVKGFVREVYTEDDKTEICLTPELTDSAKVIVNRLINPKLTVVRLWRGQNIVLI